MITKMKLNIRMIRFYLTSGFKKIGQTPGSLFIECRLHLTQVKQDFDKFYISLVKNKSNVEKRVSKVKKILR